MLLAASTSRSLHAQSGGPYEISFYTVDGGGGPASSGLLSTSAFSANGTAGQPDAGSLGAGAYVLDGGFWPGGLCRPPATPAAANDGPVCTGATLHLTASPTVSGAVYSWIGPNGFTSSLQNPAIASSTTAVAGLYQVSISLDSCASAPGQTTVVFVADGTAPTVAPPPAVVLTETVCSGN